MVQDAQGRWWAKHRETGEWHYYDGNAWVPATPPGYETETVQEQPPVQPVHQNGGPQRRGGRPWRVIVGAFAAVTVLIILVVVVASLGSSDSVDFTIRDNLGSDQVAEEVTVLIDGRNVGTLRVDQNNRTAELPVSVSSGPGRYSYTAASDTILRNGRRLSGTGQGTIDVRDGKVFELQASFSGNTWQISVVER